MIDVLKARAAVRPFTHREVDGTTDTISLTTDKSGCDLLSLVLFKPEERRLTLKLIQPL